MYALEYKTEREARGPGRTERAARRSSITERDDRIARPRRAQTCERSELRAKRAMRMYPLSGQIFCIILINAAQKHFVYRSLNAKFHYL